MDLLHRFRLDLEAKARERETARALGRLDERRLADLGLDREDVRPAARLASRHGSAGVSLDEVAAGLFSARVAHAEAELPGLSREEIARQVAEGMRLREAEIDKLLRATGRGLAGLGRALAEPVAALARATGVADRVELALARRREFQRVQRELEAYSKRELMSELRMTPSEIVDAAGEAADQREAAFARERLRSRAMGQAGRARPATAGYAGG